MQGAQDIPTLKDLCLKTVAEKTVTLAFEQKLEETGYDYDESKRWVDDIRSSVSNGVNKAHERKIKELLCKKYDEFVLHKELSHGEGVNSVVFSPNGKKIASGGLDSKVRIWKKQGFDQILFIKAVVKCAEKNNTETLKRLFYDAEMGTLFEKKALEAFREKVIEEYSISREKLAEPFYSGMMRRFAKKLFQKLHR